MKEAIRVDIAKRYFVERTKNYSQEAQKIIEILQKELVRRVNERAAKIRE